MTINPVLEQWITQFYSSGGVATLAIALRLYGKNEDEIATLIWEWNYVFYYSEIHKKIRAEAQYPPILGSLGS